MRTWFIGFQSVISLLLILILPTFSVQAVVFSSEGVELNSSDIHDLLTDSHPIYTGPVVFFYEYSCTTCLPVIYYLNQYRLSHPETEFIEHTTSSMKTKWELEKFAILHNRKVINLPVVFIGPIGIEGTDDIIRLFDNFYSWYMHTNELEYILIHKIH